MVTSKEPAQPCPSPVWEDVINDFLEMACFLSPQERARLIQELAKADIRADEIQALPTFSIEKRLISVCEKNVSPEEFWFYYPKEKKIEKIRGVK